MSILHSSAIKDPVVHVADLVVARSIIGCAARRGPVVHRATNLHLTKTEMDSSTVFETNILHVSLVKWLGEVNSKNFKQSYYINLIE